MTTRTGWCFWLTFLGCVSLAHSAFAYTVEENHPRLWVNENTVGTLEAKCRSAMSTLYDQHKATVDAGYLTPSLPLGTPGWYARNVQMLGLCNFVEGPGDTTYYAAMKRLMDYIWTQGSWEESVYYLDAMAWGYDWFNAALVTQSLDDNYGANLATATQYHVDNYLNWYATNTAHSKLSRLRVLANSGVALYGDGYGDAAATAACDTFYRHAFGDPFTVAMIDSIARDGGYFQGAYNRTVLFSFFKALWAFESGTDVAATGESSCLAGWGDYIVWDTMCRSGLPSGAYAFGMGKQGDTRRHAGTRHTLRYLVNLLASTYQDSNVQWLEEQFAVEAGTWNSNEKWPYIVMHDTLMTGVSPVTAGWPLARQFDVGTVYMRNGWDLSPPSEDIWAVYRHEQYPFGHSHADAGHFTIARGQDLLLIDTGIYDASNSIHHYEYFSQTIAHNAITIKEFGESFVEASENTGGQDRVGGHPITLGDYTADMASDEQGRGSITDFSIVTDELVYVRSDLTDAYATTKVDTVRREFAWLAKWNTFLIFDKVKLDSTGHLQKQLFHMIPNPTTTATTATWDEGGSQAKLTSLYGPATLTEVGGDGAHFMCNETNYTDELEGTEYDEGAYRIELSPARTADERWMLTAIQVTSSAAPTHYRLDLVTLGDYIGACVGLRDTLLFHKYGGAYDYRKHRIPIRRGRRATAYPTGGGGRRH